MLPVVLVALCLFDIALSGPESDSVTQLPGQQFAADFQMYSGYLKASPDGKDKLFYFLTTSSGGAKDPLVLWLNGGPGCSSLIGLFAENGPFRLDWNGSKVYENRHRWNKVANMLYIESPGGVGFSTVDGDIATDDNKTADALVTALTSFNASFPEFAEADLYLTGESYAGYYVPMLAYRLQKEKTFGDRLKGMAVGNPFLSPRALMNSYPRYLAYHDMVGLDQWITLEKQCCNGSVFCDFAKYYANDTKDVLDEQCANLTYSASRLPHGVDPYNLYYSCERYTGFLGPPAASQDAAASPLSPHLNPAIRNAHSQGLRNAMVGDSDPYGSYFASFDHCHNPLLDNGTVAYLDRDDVRTAIHVDVVHFQGASWQPCNPSFTKKKDPDYTTTRPDMFGEVEYVLESGVRTLFYSGDVDSVVNYLSTEFFVRHLMNGSSEEPITSRRPWRYRNDLASLAGFQTRYKLLDLVTVRGAGHFVPAYRPAEALKMFANFLDHKDYDTVQNISLVPLPKSVSTTTSPTTSMATTHSNSTSATVGPTTALPCGDPSKTAAVALGVCFGLALLAAIAMGILWCRARNGGYGGYLS